MSRAVLTLAVAGLCAAPVAAQTPGKDIRLGGLLALGHVARVGTFPDGLNAVTCTTTACNVGTQDVPWLAPMNEDHPVIALALYRLKDDRFEQVGRSWAKHAFFVSAGNVCGTCSNPAVTTFLPPNCSDTYTNSTNANQFYLGPREEIDPYAGTWQALGSHFDGDPVDGLRDHGNAPGEHGPLDHRCVLHDADLGNPGATYFYEGLYIVREDADTSNNLGSRLCSMTFNGTTWSYSTPATDNPIVHGPALVTRWLTGGPDEAIGTIDDPGRVYVASKATDLGAGLWHYEYAVFNFTYTRRLRSFIVPVPPGAAISAIGFHDGDLEPANDWSAAYDPDCEAVVWQTDPYDIDPQANALLWGWLFNFRFDADVAPATGPLFADAFLPGPGSDRVGTTVVVPASVPCIKGDVNGDQTLDSADIQPFVAAVVDPPCATTRAYCAADVAAEDGALDALDAAALADLLLGL